MMWFNRQSYPAEFVLNAVIILLLRVIVIYDSGCKFLLLAQIYASTDDIVFYQTDVRMKEVFNPKFWQVFGNQNLD